MCECVCVCVYVGAIHSNKKIQKVATSPKGKSTGGSVSSGRRYSPSGLRLAQSMAEVSTSSDGCRMFTSGKLQNDQMIRQTCRILQPLIHQWNSNQIQPAGYQLYNTTALPPCNVFGNGNSSKEVVTRDHHHANARSTGGNH